MVGDGTLAENEVAMKPSKATQVEAIVATMIGFAPRGANGAPISPIPAKRKSFLSWTHSIGVAV